ncbi:MAG: NUDIX hydrolase [Candidatus Competibacteraceae bacterium]|nr:NUDIX hydrolase [Candidatus Competibacteraceae bacterium]MBK7984604.1 NUDIX hydrolase [Candidatus Competibacteraceae bacterium]MBK8897142.1 NUDIX hydrolase [Candidatus Competibacteraceae bacterium]MBK8964627.1 NUDIX hydrolase [Candidatus Competibacteraceae bacterium]MBK9952624.1 NUDIX hydrolase [Candidatus Competibacteraceae bacterium]
MKFCSQCGASVTLRVPVGDNLPRYVCDACDTIHYLNPKVVAGCILEWQDRVLLCRRAIEPRYGLWTLPAGFMENGESTLAAAAREALEEAHAEGENLRLYGVYSLLHVSQVYLIFQGRLKDGYACPGEESLEVRLYAEAEIPWDQIAFTVVHEALRQYFSERRTGQFHHHLGDIIREADQRFRLHRYY